MNTLEHRLLKDEKLQSVLTEEFTTTTKTPDESLTDTDSRWTKEGLLDIREEYGQEEVVAKVHGDKVGVSQSEGQDVEQDEDQDDDFEA